MHVFLTESDLEVESVSILDTTPPQIMFALWGYDLRGSDVLEFAALISEDNALVRGNEWDDPTRLRGIERWHGTQRLRVPEWWALPWVSEALMPWGAWAALFDETFESDLRWSP